MLLVIIKTYIINLRQCQYAVHAVPERSKNTGDWEGPLDLVFSHGGGDTEQPLDIYSENS